MNRPRGALAGAVATVILLAGAWPFAEQGADDRTRQAAAVELGRRRDHVGSALGPETILVLWSAPRRVYSTDVDYPYRQESNLLYLTGVDQSETTLVLVPGARTKKALLFVRRSSAFDELWSGHSLTSSEASSVSGIATVIPQQRTEAVDEVLEALLTGTPSRLIPDAAPAEFEVVTAALRQGRLRLAVLGRLTDADPDAGLGRDAESQVAWARAMEARHAGVKAVSAAGVLRAARHVKSPYEQDLLRRSVEISAEAHLDAMRATRPGLWEYQIKARIEYGFLSRGARSWGYPPIVGSGPNATTLHYLGATRQMATGDLLLVDAAGNYQHLTGDITRTWPVSGRFSAAQRDVYEVVLRAQQAGLAVATPGRPVADVVQAVRRAIGDGLATLGLVRAADGPERDAQIDLWFPHGPVHGIGMDVHEPIETLDAGSAFVIEPGVYVRSDAFERLARTPSSQAFIDAVQPAFERYRGIGVRVEDSFLMGSAQAECLSCRVPSRVADIEAVVGRDR